MKGSKTLGNTSDEFVLIPGEFQLYQNYPNPFNPVSTIQFYVPSPSDISLSVYNLRGVVVLNLIQDTFAPGTYSIQLHSGDLSSGIYFFQLKTDFETINRKFMIIK